MLQSLEEEASLRLCVCIRRSRCQAVARRITVLIFSDATSGAPITGATGTQIARGTA